MKYLLALSDALCALNCVLKHQEVAKDLDKKNQAAFGNLERIFQILTTQAEDPERRLAATRFVYSHMTSQINTMRSSFTSAVSFQFILFRYLN